jgi:peptidase E
MEIDKLKMSKNSMSESRFSMENHPNFTKSKAKIAFIPCANAFKEKREGF